MKADHRKELQTNLLADQLGKMLQHKSSLNKVWAVLALVVVVAVGWWWWSARTEAQATGTWVEYWQGGRETASSAGSFAERHKGTSAERAAKLAEADHLFDDAFNEFFRSPEKAREQFKTASSAYKEVSDNSGSGPDLSARALLGQAICQEWLGEIDRAKHFYNELQTRYKTHALADEAGRNLKKLETVAQSAFYKEWPNRLPAMAPSAAPFPPPVPPEPPPETTPAKKE